MVVDNGIISQDLACAFLNAIEKGAKVQKNIQQAWTSKNTSKSFSIYIVYIGQQQQHTFLRACYNILMIKHSLLI